MVKRVVISGCSGGGKSSLLEEMARRGWATCEEPGRRVIRAETARGGEGLPWRDVERFARLCIRTCLADLARPARRVVFHDRSLVDAVAALRRTGRLRHEDAQLLADHRYWGTVVLAPPWRELFVADEERRHDFDEAVAEYEDLRRTYPAARYSIVELPRTTVSRRADWLEALVVQDREEVR